MAAALMGVKADFSIYCKHKETGREFFPLYRSLHFLRYRLSGSGRAALGRFGPVGPAGQRGLPRGAIWGQLHAGSKERNVLSGG